MVLVPICLSAVVNKKFKKRKGRGIVKINYSSRGN